MPSGPDRSELFWRTFESTSDFGLVGLDAEGIIRVWSLGAAAIAGYSEDEIIGSHFAILFTEEDRIAGAPSQELETARASGRAEDRRWHVGKNARFFADGITTSIVDSSGRVEGFAKVFRDATDRHLAERRLATQLAVAALFNEEIGVDDARRGVMRIICETLGWDHGGLWAVDPQRQGLRCLAVWHVENFDPALVESFCQDREFGQGEGLPGRVWASGRSLWLNEVALDPDFPRAGAAAALGFRTALGFPIIRAGEVTGVLEFFTRAKVTEDPQLLAMLGPLGSQVGDYIERRKTAEALRTSEKRYRVITETARDAIVTIDASSTILFANSAVEELFGWRPDELVGQKLHVVIPQRLHRQHDVGVARYEKTGVKRISWRGVELPGRHRDGHEVPLEISFGEWESDGRTIFSGFMRDVSERVKAREELQQTLAMEQHARFEAESTREELERHAKEEASFRHLASALTGAVGVDEVLAEITQRATRVTRADGVYVERIISVNGDVEVRAVNGKGTPESGLRIAYPGSMTEEIMERKTPAILASMTGIGSSMAPYLQKSCGECEVLVVPLVTGTETLGALVLLNSSDSGRHFGEDDVAKGRALGDLTSLALRRARMMENEKAARATAEEAVKSRDRTLGIVSHDLRNPLTKISLAAQMLEELPDDDPAEQVTVIRTAARQMNRLIEDLLDAARIEQRGLRVRARAMDVTETIGHACASNRAIADQRSQTIECRVPDDLPLVSADPDRVLQVLNNLIANSIKFIPEGGRILISAVAADDDFVAVSVADDGPGVPEGKEQELFESWWQAPGASHPGAGLGLSIVKGIVEAHGGTVAAKNGESGGAIFTFTLPRAQTEA
ncbi:MAG TPA: PAS domain S-box protein [Thermoanaerobaculia bacterium]|nr:PAS domain S-box protein [Thermoanaerobaculia bacterium]